MPGPTAHADYSGTGPLAALASVFTPPCPTSWLLTTTTLFSQYPPFPTTGPTSCDPPAWRPNIANAGFHYYSPAVCPQGFGVGPSCGITKTRTDEGFPALKPGETAVYCVPIGLTCTTDITDYRGGVWGFAQGDFVTVGPAIQIRWAEADLTALETHPLTPGRKPAQTSATAAPTSAMESATRSSADTTGELAESESTGTVKKPDESYSFLYETTRPTASVPPADTAAGRSNGSGGLGSLNRTTSIVVIVIVTVVAGILLWTAAFLVVRRYKQRLGERKPSDSSRESDASGLEQGRRRSRYTSGAPKSVIASPASELDAGPPAIGTTPNPAELEGDILAEPTRPWMRHKSWLKNSSLQPPQSSPRSVLSARRTIRESFGEKINDPAAVLGRLRIPNPLSVGRPSPSSASPSARSFWRLPRSPRSPAASAESSKPSSRSGPNVDASTASGNASSPGRGRPEWQVNGGSSQRDAMP